MTMGRGAGIAVGPVHELIARLCRLQRTVAEHQGHDHAADCICGEGGYWQESDTWPIPSASWCNEGRAIRFIEQAVAEKIERERAEAKS
jgi:hypothetical protein